MRPRNPILVGVLAGLLFAAFHHTALATNFTNGDFVTFTQGDWGDTPAPANAAGLLENNYDTVWSCPSNTLVLSNRRMSGKK